jgi:hypothetical protein
MSPSRASDLPLKFHPTTVRALTVDTFGAVRTTGALDVNSVPLSDTIIPGFPRVSVIVASSRATRLPEIEVSGPVMAQTPSAEGSAMT